MRDHIGAIFLKEFGPKVHMLDLSCGGGAQISSKRECAKRAFDSNKLGHPHVCFYRLFLWVPLE